MLNKSVDTLINVLSDISDSILSNVWSYGKANQNLLIDEQTIKCPKQDKTMAHETPHRNLKIEHYKNYFKFM